MTYETDQILSEAIDELRSLSKLVLVGQARRALEVIAKDDALRAARGATHTLVVYEAQEMPYRGKRWRKVIRQEIDHPRGCDAGCGFNWLITELDFPDIFHSEDGMGPDPRLNQPGRYPIEFWATSPNGWGGDYDCGIDIVDEQTAEVKHEAAT